MVMGLRQATNFRATLRVYIIPIIALFLGFAGILGFNLNFFNQLYGETKIAVIFISIIAFYFFVAHVTTRAKWEKFFNYANLYHYLNEGFKEIHHLHRKDDSNINREEIIQSFKILCTHLADGFGLVTHTKCSVCIKILVEAKTENEDDLEFETLCRDLRAGARRLKNDEISKSNGEIFHTLENNTAFKEALFNNENMFLSNKLPMLNNYNNTSDHRDLYGKQPESQPLRVWSWDLPYRSTVVVPIIPSHNEYPYETKESVIGFLCLDSNSWGVFNKEFDGVILKGIADGIYNTLVKFKEVVDREKNSSIT